MAEIRTASTPTTGALRDALRTTVAFVVVWALTKVVGAQIAADMSPTIDAAIVVAISAAFAWFGKRSRDKAGLAGKVI
jgi:hypothetical protein